MNKILKIVIAFCLLLGILSLPIGYYTYLRIAVSIAALIIIIQNYKQGFSIWNMLFVLLVILFNPIFPIYFNNKEIWIIIDFAAALIFGISAFIDNKK